MMKCTCFLCLYNGVHYGIESDEYKRINLSKENVIGKSCTMNAAKPSEHDAHFDNFHTLTKSTRSTSVYEDNTANGATWVFCKIMYLADRFQF